MNQSTRKEYRQRETLDSSSRSSDDEGTSFLDDWDDWFSTDS